jgi:ABC-type proline/glycine betaine transport system ATPase subunit
MVFQDYAPVRVSAHRAGRRWVCRIDGAERERRIDELLDQVGLAGRKSQMPHELSSSSSGWRWRGIARTPPCCAG